MSEGDETLKADVLLVDRVAAGYGGAMVINEVTVQVARGEVVTVFGPNGAGKSTLLKAITGGIHVSEGRVVLDGATISGRRPHQIARLGVGYVPQIRDVFTKLSVLENLEMGGYTQNPRAVRERIDEVIAVFPALGPMRGRRAGTLSGGERKMLAVGRALMTRPSLLLLDEPTANLSPLLAKEFLREHVGKLAEQGAAVLMVEQRAIEALSVSARGYLMTAGRVEEAAEASYFLEHEDIGALFLGRKTEHVAGAGVAKAESRATDHRPQV